MTDPSTAEPTAERTTGATTDSGSPPSGAPIDAAPTVAAVAGPVEADGTSDLAAPDAFSPERRRQGIGGGRVLGAVAAVLGLAAAALGVLIGLRVADGTPPTRVWNVTAAGTYKPGSVVGGDQQAALDAAVKAVPLLLSYDYRALPANLVAAKTVLTTSYAQTFVQTFAASVEANATTNKAVVESLVRAAGVSGKSNGTVTCLVFVDATLVSSASSTTAQVNQDSVVFSLQKVGGRWLVSGVAPTT